MGKKQIFNNNRLPVPATFTFVILCLAFFLLGKYWLNNKDFTSLALEVSRPIYWLANLPVNLIKDMSSGFTTRKALSRENQNLKNQVLILQSRVVNVNNVIAENTRLRRLLNTIEIQDYQVKIAELIALVPKSRGNRVIINRGKKDGVFKWQSVLDSKGLYGQVTSVSSHTSMIMLISDHETAIPVESVRNGYRTIAQGVGQTDKMKLRYVAETTDIQVGDMFVSSGLGERFRRGYSVGKVVAINPLEGTGFLQVELAIKARLAIARELLLITEK